MVMHVSTPGLSHGVSESRSVLHESPGAQALGGPPAPASHVCQAGGLRGSPEPGRQAHPWAPDPHSPRAVVNKKQLGRCPTWCERSPGSPLALSLGRELRVAGRREPASQVLEDVEGQTADQSDDRHFPQEGQRGDEVHVCGQTAQGWAGVGAPGAPGCQPDPPRSPHPSDLLLQLPDRP